MSDAHENGCHEPGLHEPGRHELLPRIGDRLADLSTPRPVVDEDRMAANIARVQAYMDANGRHFRPHIKTHKIPAIAAAQVAAGARGINCQKVSEAEVFAQAGFDDILVTFNVMGNAKLERLAWLNGRIAGLKVTADNAETVEGLARRFAPEARPLAVMVECETGAKRCGVPTPEAAASLAQQIAGSPGLAFAGLMTYPPTKAAAAIDAFMAQTLDLLAEAGIVCPAVSVGGTPSLFEAHLIASATEHRAGTYVYNDRAMVRAGHCRLDDCAMHVLATVVSRPAQDRAVIDAGSKALTSDLFGMFSDYGLIEAYPQARIVSLSEEHGVIDLAAVPGPRPAVGEQVRIVPNHTCVVSNLFDHMVFHRGGVVTRIERVAARGLVW